MTWFLLAAISIYFLDLLSKMAVRKFMAIGQEIALLPFFSLYHIQNTGIAFGLFQGWNLVFIILGIGMMIFIGWLAKNLSQRSLWEAWGLGFILGGALGNITDRIIFGRVTDFLDFYIGAHHWPAFNVADSAICVGAFCLALGEIISKREC